MPIEALLGFLDPGKAALVGERPGAGVLDVVEGAAASRL